MENNMINYLSPSDIGFESYIIENMSIEDLFDLYPDSYYIIINVRYDMKTQKGNFVEIIYDNEEHKVLEGTAYGKSSFNVYLTGLKEALEQLDDNCNIILVTPTQIGLKGGFEGKGANGAFTNSLLNLIKEKNCTLKELFYPGGVDVIRGFLAKYVKFSTKHHNKPRTPKEEYNYCLSNVIEILKSNDVEPQIISQVLDLKR